MQFDWLSGHVWSCSPKTVVTTCGKLWCLSTNKQSTLSHTSSIKYYILKESCKFIGQEHWLKEPKFYKIRGLCWDHFLPFFTKNEPFRIFLKNWPLSVISSHKILHLSKNQKKLKNYGNLWRTLWDIILLRILLLDWLPWHAWPRLPNIVVSTCTKFLSACEKSPSSSKLCS